MSVVNSEEIELEIKVEGGISELMEHRGGLCLMSSFVLTVNILTVPWSYQQLKSIISVNFLCISQISNNLRILQKVNGHTRDIVNFLRY